MLQPLGHQEIKCWYNYDSAYIRWDSTAISFLKKQFWCSASNTAIVNGVQKQHGDKERGIANATSMAFGKDPSKMSYKELVAIA